MMISCKYNDNIQIINIIELYINNFVICEILIFIISYISKLVGKHFSFSDAKLFNINMMVPINPVINFIVINQIVKINCKCFIKNIIFVLFGIIQ